MQYLDQQIEEAEEQLSSLRVQIFTMKKKLRTKYYTKLESEFERIESKLEAIKDRLEKSYAADTELFDLQRENYFLKQGIGKEEMKEFIENMERRNEHDKRRTSRNI